MQPFISHERARPLFLLAALAAITFGLAACGGGDDGSPVAALPASTPPAQAPGQAIPGPTAGTPGAANPLPSVAGTPPTAALQDKPYSFTPATNPAAPGPLSFSITGKPAWATFNPESGELSGTPGAADVGVHKNISISVTDGTTTTVLAAWDIEVVAAGAAHGAVTVSWRAPVRNADGTPLTDLAGFRIYWGTREGDYPNSVTIDNPGVTTYVVDQLLPATYYFVVRAVNEDGVESNDSKVGSKTIS
jgi:hypothetical protein